MICAVCIIISGPEPPPSAAARQFRRRSPNGHDPGGISIEAKLFAGIALFLALVVTATVIWGPVGLAMSALACVPFCYAGILLITVGK